VTYTDYNLPKQKWAAMSAEEKDQWFKLERAKRRAMTQQTGFGNRVEIAQKRIERRLEARPDTVNLEDYR
jgi:hypothetical protein